MVVATKAEVEALFNVGGARLKPNEYILDVDKVLGKNINDVMLRLGDQIVKNLEKNTPVSSGKLTSSYEVLGVKETKTGYRLEIGVGADYSDYVDKGVKGIRNKRKTYPNQDGKHYQFKTYFMPPEALVKLEGWMRRKNMEIEATNLIEGRQMLPQISSSAKRMAYYIKKYGIEGKQFVKKSIDEATPQFNIDIQEIGFNSLVLKVSK